MNQWIGTTTTRNDQLATILRIQKTEKALFFECSKIKMNQWIGTTTTRNDQLATILRIQKTEKALFFESIA